MTSSICLVWDFCFAHLICLSCVAPSDDDRKKIRKITNSLVTAFFLFLFHWTENENAGLTPRTLLFRTMSSDPENVTDLKKKMTMH